MQSRRSIVKQTRSERLPWQNSGSHDITIGVSFCVKVAKTPTYPVMCLFLLFCTVTNRQTDRRHACSKNVTRYVCYAAACRANKIADFAYL